HELESHKGEIDDYGKWYTNEDVIMPLKGVEVIYQICCQHPDNLGIYYMNPLFWSDINDPAKVLVPSYPTELNVTNKDLYIGQKVWCEEDAYVSGFKIDFLWYQGQTTDDIGISGITIQCSAYP